MLNNKTLLLKLILLVSFVALISALFIEYVLGHQPCNLCILERIPYVFAIVIILLNYKFSNFEKLSLFLLIIIFPGLWRSLKELLIIDLYSSKSEKLTVPNELFSNDKSLMYCACTLICCWVSDDEFFSAIFSVYSPRRGI